MAPVVVSSFQFLIRVENALCERLATDHERFLHKRQVDFAEQVATFTARYRQKSGGLRQCILRIKALPPQGRSRAFEVGITSNTAQPNNTQLLLVGSVQELETRTQGLAQTLFELLMSEAAAEARGAADTVPEAEAVAVG